MFGKTTLIAALAAIALAGSAHAGVIPIVDTTGHNDKNNFGGNQDDLFGGESSGMDFNGAPDDPSQWRAVSNSFGNEWQSADQIAGGINGKIGWVTLDLGSVVSQLDSLYIWNLRENTAQGRRIVDYNVYISGTPAVTPPAAPTNNDSVDYDFASGGWAKLNGSPLTLAQRGASPDPAQAVIDLGGASARYIGLELLTSGGSATRIGLAEVAVTQVIPEPGSLALLGLGGLLVARRRRA